MEWTGLDWICKTWTGFVKGGFVKGGFVKGGFVKHGFVKGGFVKHGFVSFGRVNYRVLIMFYWAAKNSKFPADKWRFDKTNPHCSVPLSNSNIFVDLLRIKDKFHCQDSIIIYKVSAY